AAPRTSRTAGGRGAAGGIARRVAALGYRRARRAVRPRRRRRTARTPAIVTAIHAGVAAAVDRPAVLGGAMVATVQVAAAGAIRRVVDRVIRIIRVVRVV